MHVFATLLDTSCYREGRTGYGDVLIFCLWVSDVSYTSRIVPFGICRYVWPLCGYNHTTARRMVREYTEYDVLLIKVASDDGLIQSETCRASNGK